MIISVFGRPRIFRLPREIFRQWWTEREELSLDALSLCEYRQLVYDTIIDLHHSIAKVWISGIRRHAKNIVECEGLNGVEEMARWLGSSITSKTLQLLLLKANRQCRNGPGAVVRKYEAYIVLISV